ncbi:hypothetical protein BDW66DRAFT_56716 [Aspergillus desertorum]
MQSIKPNPTPQFPVADQPHPRIPSCRKNIPSFRSARTQLLDSRVDWIVDTSGKLTTSVEPRHLLHQSNFVAQRGDGRSAAHIGTIPRDLDYRWRSLARSIPRPHFVPVQPALNYPIAMTRQPRIPHSPGRTNFDSPMDLTAQINCPRTMRVKGQSWGERESRASFVRKIRFPPAFPTVDRVMGRRDADSAVRTQPAGACPWQWQFPGPIRSTGFWGPPESQSRLRSCGATIAPRSGVIQL